MHKWTALVIMLCNSVLATAQTADFDVCNDLKKSAAMVVTPSDFKQGEGVIDDPLIHYNCRLTFRGATRSEALYWEDGTLSNVMQFFGESLTEQQALEVYDLLAAQFRSCYSAIQSEPGPLGLRNDLSFRIHPNLIARLTMYYGQPAENGDKTYKVFFDLYYAAD